MFWNKPSLAQRVTNHISRNSTVYAFGAGVGIGVAGTIGYQTAKELWDDHKKSQQAISANQAQQAIPAQA